MRRRFIAAALLTLVATPALAGCDLSRVVGYTLVGIKPIDSYIDTGKQKPGFDGCAPDRVIVFKDRTGLRCKDTFLHHSSHPVGYLFARSNTDMKLCVDDDFYNVAPPN